MNAPKRKGSGCLRFFLFFVIFVLLLACLGGIALITLSNYGYDYYSKYLGIAETYIYGENSSANNVSSTVNSQAEVSSKEAASLEPPSSSSQEESSASPSPINTVPITALKPDKKSYAVEANRKTKIAVTYSPAAAKGQPLSWSSDDTSIAEVDAEGNVSGKFPGECSITAASTQDASIKFTVPVLVVKPGEHPSASKYLLRVYKGSQSVVAYTKDVYGSYSIEERVMPCSTGAKGTPTFSGNYQTINKYRWRLMMGPTYGQYATSFSSAYLFHSVPSSKQNLHSMSMGGYSALGRTASHGCVRLCVRDAKWIYDNCELSTPVEVVDDTGPYGEPLPPLNWDYYGWDPTDPDPSSPYNK
ncbi:MAG: L,D-transpeptidase family protein [Oscillospiraceae bacterium]|jgi:lipoprotein-anchoring transpeptidase ErfK/SrfK|nr:L,D-transpeptidase family protein [Oscillospiraceae bacterium]